MTEETATTAETFLAYQKSPTGRMRYLLAQENLEALHSLARELRVLDAAGGNGINASWFLNRGHSVTLLDSDPAMLAQARRGLADPGSVSRLALVPGTLERVAELLPAASFDLIVCHHVLEYLADPRGVLGALGKVAAPAGELSLVTLNPVSEVIRAVVFGKDAALARARLTDLSYDARWFGQATLYPMEQVVKWGEGAGWSLRDFRGIRVLADYVPDAQYTEALERDVMRMERELAGREPYRRFGRYLQLCFEKRT